MYIFNSSRLHNCIVVVFALGLTTSLKLLCDLQRSVHFYGAINNDSISWRSHQVKGQIIMSLSRTIGTLASYSGPYAAWVRGYWHLYHWNASSYRLMLIPYQEQLTALPLLFTPLPLPLLHYSFQAGISYIADDMTGWNCFNNSNQSDMMKASLHPSSGLSVKKLIRSPTSLNYIASFFENVFKCVMYWNCDKSASRCQMRKSNQQEHWSKWGTIWP